MPACPGATGCGYATVFTAYECLTFHHRILTCQPALVRRDVDMQLFSLLMNASLCITASCHARSGPGVWARAFMILDRYQKKSLAIQRFFIQHPVSRSLKPSRLEEKLAWISITDEKDLENPNLTERYYRFSTGFSQKLYSIDNVR